ncbi:unnamed protein product [Ilex paraguariensis]|uniref:RING-type E3 ubiquitin transferase n=1 Tax=Ilex paraguariensis TaxID=185542 RepID=A0ABC8TJR6_9AQUA
MSFVFRGTRADVESGFPGFIPERRAVRVHAARPVNTNSLAFLVTVLLLFMILNSHQLSPNFLLWLVLGVFLMATSLRMYATCQQLQAQAQAHAVAASGLLGHTELRLHMPPSITLATRGRLQGLRLQLALLDREFDDLDYETLRALDADNVPTATSMTEEEINSLPVHKYKVAGPQSTGSPMHQASSSAIAEAIKDLVNDVNFDCSATGFSLLAMDSCHVALVTLLLKSKDLSITTVTLCTISLGIMYLCAGFLNSTGSPMHQASSSAIAEKKQETINGSIKASDDDLTCSVCLEQVNVGELIRSLPCLHQFHANCIDPWLRQQGTCPVCKFKAGSGWHENGLTDMDASYMV